MVTFRSIIIFMVMAALLFMGAACSSNEPTKPIAGADEEKQPVAERTLEKEQPVAATQENQPGMESEEMAKQASPAAMPKTLALTGTVSQAGDDLLLVTDSADFILTGQDLSAMVGKTIMVTGALEEIGGKNTINVISFSEKQE